LRGFGIFLGCIALGVAAIAGVSSLSSTLKDGLARQGRTILGGDVTFNLFSRTLDAAEKDFQEGQGRLAPVALMRAMARNEAGEAALVELKAVNGTYHWPARSGRLVAAWPVKYGHSGMVFLESR